jgi:hypothetical protein
MLLLWRKRFFKLRFSLSPSPKAWPSRGDSIEMDSPFSTAKAQEQIPVKSTPTSTKWESLGKLSQAVWQKMRV